jgi:vesicle coat complex subunit
MKKILNKPLTKWLVGCLGILLVGWITYLMPLGRELAVIVLGKMGPVAVPFLRHALNDDDNGVRWAAHDALKELGAGAVPSLVRALRDRNAQVRAEAAEAFFVIGSNAKDALPDLIAAFNDPDDTVRVKAMGALKYFDHEKSLAALPTLLAIARADPNGHVRAVAVETAGMFSPLEMERVTPAILQSLKDQDAEVRTEAAEALGKLARYRVMHGKSFPQEAISALKEALNDPNKDVRDEAAEALSMIGIREETSAEKDPLSGNAAPTASPGKEGTPERR